MGDTGILGYVKVSPPQAKFLEFVGERAGEIEWHWDRCRPDAAAMVGDLVKKGLLADLRAEQKLRLTDQGRSALTQIGEALRKAPRIIST